MMLKLKNPMLLLGIIFLLVSCEKKKPVSENIKNAKQFFNQLTEDNEIWIYKPGNSTVHFENFIMKFKMQGRDTLIGRISGVHINGDTIPFWNVKEIIDYSNDRVLFEQSGSMGKAKSISTFPKPTVRKAEFEINYVDGTTQKHRDTHIIISDNEIRTESEVYKQEDNEWVKQPQTIWKKVN